MRAVIQRAARAKVIVEDEVTGSIDRGLVVFLSIDPADEQEDLKWLSRKILRMRIFEDEEGKMNDSVRDIEGAVLVVSQFTLHASTKKGNRPSFTAAASPDKAKRMYDHFVDRMRTVFKGSVQTGRFGAMMDVSLVNDGPVTIWMDTKNRE